MKVLTKRLKEITDVAKNDLTVFDIYSYMHEILQLVNHDAELKSEIAAWNNKILVFEAADTGKAISINFTGGTAIGQVGRRDDFDLKFEATERTYLDLLTGGLEPDSAFFRRKIKIIGPIFLALKFKNIFFAKISAI